LSELSKFKNSKMDVADAHIASGLGPSMYCESLASVVASDQSAGFHRNI
jgi:hypothetical protein